MIAVRHGTFAAWMMQREQLGIQDNVPLKVTDQAVFGESRMVAAEWLTGSSH